MYYKINLNGKTITFKVEEATKAIIIPNIELSSRHEFLSAWKESCLLAFACQVQHYREGACVEPWALQAYEQLTLPLENPDKGYEFLKKVCHKFDDYKILQEV